jgi:hypothetical protein
MSVLFPKADITLHVRYVTNCDIDYRIYSSWALPDWSIDSADIRCRLPYPIIFERALRQMFF